VSRGSVALLLAAGALLSGCVAFWVRCGDVTGRVGAHLAVYALAFVAYLLALRAGRCLGGRGLLGALLLAVVWRLALVASPPLLSDDVYRYLWEGRVQLQGGNPYAWSDRPESARWLPLRDDQWRLVAHKSYTAVYPPLWQLMARGVAWVSPCVAAMKTVLVACELGLWAVLALMLRGRGLPPSRLLVIAWSPLALVEVAGSGHNDVLGVLCLGLALLALERGSRGLSAAAVAMGFQAKLLPGLVGLAWARRYRPRDVGLAAATALLVAVPYLSAGRGLWRTLDAYGSWRFNESALALLDRVAPSREAALRCATALVAGLALVLAARRTEPVKAGLAVVVVSVALAAHVLPWYALWLLPWLVLIDAPGALLFTWTVGFAYLVYPAWQSGEAWHVGWGIRALEYGPCLALAAWLRARRPGRREAA
jgi:alpha-1,6-mannosyltransferase